MRQRGSCFRADRGRPARASPAALRGAVPPANRACSGPLRRGTGKKVCACEWSFWAISACLSACRCASERPKLRATRRYARRVLGPRTQSTIIPPIPSGEWRGRPTGNGCIHEYLDLNMNRGGPFYHEYEWRRARPIMNTNSKRFAIFNSTHMNRFLFMYSSGQNAAPPAERWNTRCHDAASCLGDAGNTSWGRQGAAVAHARSNVRSLGVAARRELRDDEKSSCTHI